MGEDFYDQSIAPYLGIIIKICRAYSNTPEEFDDCYQEVCLQVWRSKDNFHGNSSWSTWLYRVALNVCLTMIKGKSKAVHSPLEPDSMIAGGIAADDRMQEDEALTALYAAIRQLREADRAVILLYLEEKSYQDIADILGMSQSNIGVRISRIKEKLTALIA